MPRSDDHPERPHFAKCCSREGEIVLVAHADGAPAPSAKHPGHRRLAVAPADKPETVGVCACCRCCLSSPPRAGGAPAGLANRCSRMKAIEKGGEMDLAGNSAPPSGWNAITAKLCEQFQQSLQILASTLVCRFRYCASRRRAAALQPGSTRRARSARSSSVVMRDHLRPLRQGPNKLNEAHTAHRDLPIRTVIDRMRHDGCAAAGRGGSNCSPASRAPAAGRCGRSR